MLNSRLKLIKKDGITLVALIITIVILIILATLTINILFREGGIVESLEQAKKITDSKTEEEEEELDQLESYLSGIIISEDGYNENDRVNEPELTEGMIPVYYDNGVWRKADENNINNQWYNYDEKKWANIVTVSDENANLRTALVGTEISMKDRTTFYVWIPRYAYSITNGYKLGSKELTGKIDITFLKGNTNTGIDNINYPTDYNQSELQAGDVTPKIVHSAFSQNGKELRGIWVAKFEASGTDISGEAVGNRKNGTVLIEPDETTYVKILPSKISWRDITIGEAQYQSTRMLNNKPKYGWDSSVDSHLIKNSEWGAVAYLCYSDYGNIPKINANIDMYTGAGPKDINNQGTYQDFTEAKYGYNTTLGVLASTTGNVYGIYDMAGGANEFVASYLDNENVNLNDNGKSTSNENVKYFERGELKLEYSNLWEKYSVSKEEKSNKIIVEGLESPVTQEELWNWNKKTVEYNTVRRRLTEANFNLMASHKGIGVNETASSFCFFAPSGTNAEKQTWACFQTIKDTAIDTTQEFGKSWNADAVIIGHVNMPFITRGGGKSDNSFTGVLYINSTKGSGYLTDGFRPALYVK